MIRKIAVIFLIIIPCALFSQNNLHFDDIDLGKVYSNEVTYSSCIDSLGNLWVGTESGLVKYDGVSYEVYTHNPNNENSLSGNIVSFVFTDAKSNIWVGTKTGGLNKYVDGDFIHYFKMEDMPEGTGSTWIRDMVQDESGKLWIAMDGAGLALFDPETEGYRLFTTDSTNITSISGNAVTSLCKTKSGNLFVGTYAGLCQLDPKDSNKFIRYSHKLNPNSSRVMSITEDSDSNIWIGSWRGGLSKVDEQNRICIPNENLPSSYSIVGMNSTEKNILLIGSWGDGVVQYNILSGEVYVNDEVKAKSIGMKSSGIRSIYKDQSNIYWISSNNGIFKLDKYKRKFNSSMFKSNMVIDGNSPEIKGFIEFGESEVLVATEKGIRVFNCKKNTYNQRLEQSLNKVFREYMINKIEINNNQIYIATRENGLYILDMQFNILEHLDENLILSDDKEFNNFLSDFFIEDSIIYIASRSIWKYNSITKNLSHLFELDNQFATQILKDSKGNLWVGAWTVGLHKYSENGSVDSYLYQENNNAGIQGNSINCIYEDSKGILWVSAEKGLSSYNYATDIFEKVVVDPESKNIAVMSLQEAADGQLWVSTETGLALYNREEDIFSVYDNSNGLLEKDFVYSSSMLHSNGELYFGAQTGFLNFNPDSLWYKNTVPRINLIGVFEHCNGKSLRGRSGIIKVRRNASYCIKLNLDDLTSPGRNRFFYKILDIDSIWIDNGYDETIKINTKTRGIYKYSFKGANIDSKISENKTEITIKVISPLLNLLWVLLFTILSFFIIYKIRNKNIRQAKYARSSLTNDAMHEYIEKLKAYMMEEKPFLNEEIYLKDVADKLEINQNYLSQAINDVLKKNFFDFINDYRVEEAKRLLSDIKYNNMNLLGIGFESGFNSKTSFYTIFKKHTGQTPAAYRKASQW